MSVPDHIGRYQIVGPLATGGMAQILLGSLAGPEGFRRPVVIKRVLPHLAEKREFKTMFIDEARLVAGIRHSNVVTVYELGSEGGELFLVMEYLEGESVAALLRRLQKDNVRLPPEIAAYIAAEAAAGLHAAHEYVDDSGVPQQVVHRDVSPQNLIVNYDGSIKVIDFGIARAKDRGTKTRAGALKGKFAYMAPEQASRGEIDRRVDVYALGVVLHEMLTGKRLFVGTEAEMIKAICFEHVPTPREFVPDIPEELEAIVLRAMSRDVNTRYPTAAAFRQALIEYLRGLTSHGREHLVEIMERLFPDRRAEKRDMLRKVRQGADVASLPVNTDDDEDDEEPEEIDPDDPSLAEPAAMFTPMSLDGHSPLPTTHPGSSGAPRWLVGLVVATFLGAVGGGVFLTLKLRQQSSVGGTIAQPLVVDAGVSEVVDAAVVVAPPTPQRVRVQIVSTPSRATVATPEGTALECFPLPEAGSSSDHPDGQTPCTLVLPFGEGMQEIVIARDGYREARQTVSLSEPVQAVAVSLPRMSSSSGPRQRDAGTGERTERPPPETTPQQPGRCNTTADCPAQHFCLLHQCRPRGN